MGYESNTASAIYGTDVSEGIASKGISFSCLTAIIDSYSATAAS